MEDRLKNVEDIMKKYNDIKDSLEPKVDENFEKEIQDKKHIQNIFNTVFRCV